MQAQTALELRWRGFGGGHGSMLTVPIKVQMTVKPINIRTNSSFRNRAFYGIYTNGASGLHMPYRPKVIEGTYEDQK
jgi:hypothetical protein